jgi:hypothetical protein
MFRDRSEHLQPFLSIGFVHLGVILNPRVDPYYFASEIVCYLALFPVKPNRFRKS